MKKLLLIVTVLASSFITSVVSAASGEIAYTNNGTTLVKNPDLTLTLIINTDTGKVVQITEPTMSPELAIISQETSQSGSTQDTTPKKRVFEKKFNRMNGPALDLRSTDIVSYRKTELKNQGIRYVKPVFSVRVRAQASRLANTLAFLIRNDAIQLTNTGIVSGGWTKATTLEGGKTGFIGSKYIREPNVTDLVRIKKADQAYWSDIGHAQVASKVNVRVEPWYGARILAVFDNQTPLYILDEVNGWMEILTDGGVHGYIKSTFVETTKYQKEDWIQGVR